MMAQKDVANRPMRIDMPSELEFPSESQEAESKFDTRTFLLGLRRRWYLFVIGAALAIVAAPLAGKRFGKQTYQAETMLLFRRPAEAKYSTDERTALMTLKDTIKLRNNIEETGKRLGLAETPEAIGKDCDVEVQKNTTLLLIKVRYRQAKTAADIANTLRNVFLQRQRSKDTTQSLELIHKLERDIEKVRNRLKEADRQLSAFTRANQIVDIEKQAKSYLEAFNSINELYEQAQTEKRTTDEQSRQLDNVIADLKAKVSREKSSMAELEKLSDINIRIGKLRERISEDKSTRSNAAELAFREKELARAKQLYEMGAISLAELQRTQTNYDKQKVQTEDTEQIGKWKSELAKLEQSVIPSASANPTQSAPILQEMLVRAFDIQLKKVSNEERVKYLATARQNAKAQLDRIPMLQSQYQAFKRNITSAETERTELEGRLERARFDYGVLGADFTVITEASVPEKPLKSTATMLMAGAGGGFFLLFAVIAALLEITDRTVRSPNEVQTRLRAPLLGAIPRQRRRRGVLHVSPNSVLGERFASLARRIRQELPAPGACLLVASAIQGEGVTTVVNSLAASLGRQGEQVVVIEAQRDSSPRAEGQTLGLEDYLLARASALDEILYPTELKNVSYLPRFGAEISPDDLASERMAQLIEELRNRFGVILIETSPILNCADAELLASHADGVALVARSRGATAKTIKQAIAKLGQTGARLLGVALNRVSRLYMVE